MISETVKLKHKRKPGRFLIVNLTEYATDLGKEKFKAYELVNAYRGDESTPSVLQKPATANPPAQPKPTTAKEPEKPATRSSGRPPKPTA